MELPLWNEKRYAPYKIGALVEVLAEQGIAPKASLAGTSLTPESLSDPETLTSVRQYITACHNALQLSKTPETPFLTGSRIPLSAYGMYGFALVCSPTIREYFQMAIKYHRLATPLLSMSWREEGDFCCMGLPDECSGDASRLVAAVSDRATADAARDASESRGRKRCIPAYPRYARRTLRRTTRICTSATWDAR
jgi:hypothetical protein